MFSVLLEELPQKWNGYDIDTDFRTGIQISQCLADDSLEEYERVLVAIDLLFPDIKPDIEEALKGLMWYLTDFNHDNKGTNKPYESIIMDFDIDQWRIYSAFRAQYGIDLNTEDMHWFVFMGLLTNLEECTFTWVMDIRQKKITGKMSSEERKAIKEAKKVFAIKQTAVEEKLTPEEQERVNEFMRYVNQGK